jgi:hypothetical protein
VTASVTKSTNEEIEIFRENDITSARLRASLKLSPRSTLSAYAAYSDIDRITLTETTNSIVKEAGIDLERRFTRRFFGTIGYQFLDRSGDNIGNAGGIQGITGPLTDNRISASIRYEFDNNF